MDGNIYEALKLMCIGLGTVFVALVLIIEFGKLLISLVNKFAPEEEAPVKATQTNNTINPKVAEAIALAVANLTGGKGKVDKIEKI